MNIIFVVASNGIGGAEKRTFKTAIAVSRQNPSWTVLVLSYGDTIKWFRLMMPFYGEKPPNLIFRSLVFGGYGEKFAKRESALVKTGILSRALERYWIMALQRLVRKGFDRLHVSYGIKGVHAALSCAQTRKIIVNIEVTSQRYVDKLISEISHFKTPHAGMVKFVCVSDSVKKKFVASSPSEVWLNGLSWYPGPGFIDIKVADKKNINRKQIIVFPHRVSEQKNAPLFANCVKRLIAQGFDNWHFRFLGTAPAGSKVFRILQSEIESGVVQFGRVNALEEYVSEASIAVSVISTGTYPSQSMFECLSQGCIAVIAPVTEQDRCFEGEGTFFCEMSQNSICAALHKLMRSLEDRAFEKRARLGAIKTARRLAFESKYLDSVVGNFLR